MDLGLEVKKKKKNIKWSNFKIITIRIIINDDDNNNNNNNDDDDNNDNNNKKMMIWLHKWR